jgi:hypothetical protein
MGVRPEFDAAILNRNIEFIVAIVASGSVVPPGLRLTNRTGRATGMI